MREFALPRLSEGWVKVQSRDFGAIKRKPLAVETLAGSDVNEGVGRDFPTCIDFTRRARQPALPGGALEVRSSQRMAPAGPAKRRANRVPARTVVPRSGERRLPQLRDPLTNTSRLLGDGNRVQRWAASAEWTTVAVDLTGVSQSKRFVLEIRRDEKAANFDDNCFDVRDRQVYKRGLLQHLAQRIFRRTFGQNRSATL